MITIIADDLSGACDTAVKLCRWGVPVQVLPDPDSPLPPPEQSQVLAVSTNTRALEGGEAARRTRACAQRLRQRPAGTVFKKVDSLLRGNVGEEIQAVSEGLGRQATVFAPAVPHFGRLVLNGVLQAGDREVDIPGRLTEGQRARCAVVPLADIARGADHLREVIRSLLARGKTFLLMDADSDQALDAIAAACGALPEDVLLAGASGLMDALARQRPAVAPGASPQRRQLERLAAGCRRLLFIVGTCHPVTRAQVRRLLERTDTALVSVDAAACVEGRAASQIRRCLEEAQAQADRGARSILLAASSVFAPLAFQGQGSNGENSVDAIVSGLAQAAAAITRQIPFDAVLASGGDTAHRVLSTLGISSIALLAEFAPGAPVGVVPLAGRPVLVATKSGGFGDEDTLAQFGAWLRRTAGAAAE